MGASETVTARLYRATLREPSRVGTVNRALLFPTATVTHLEAVVRSAEVADLLALEGAGMNLGLVALPPAVEDSLYRFNNLPGRLAALYGGIDPLDPDEDLLEEAEERAVRLIDQAHNLDEVIDAVYEALEGMPTRLMVRRPGEAEGLVVTGRRGALLALKALARTDWSVPNVMARLTETASVAVDARAVFVHAAVAAPDPRLSARASQVLGRDVEAFGWEGSVTGVR